MVADVLRKIVVVNPQLRHVILANSRRTTRDAQAELHIFLVVLQALQWLVRGWAVALVVALVTVAAAMLVALALAVAVAAAFMVAAAAAVHRLMPIHLIVDEVDHEQRTGGPGGEGNLARRLEIVTAAFAVSNHRIHARRESGMFGFGWIQMSVSSSVRLRRGLIATEGRLKKTCTPFAFSQHHLLFGVYPLRSKVTGRIGDR